MYLGMCFFKYFKPFYRYYKGSIQFFKTERLLFMKLKYYLFLLVTSFILCSCSTTTTSITSNEAPVAVDGRIKYGYTLVDGMDLKESERGILFVFNEPVNFQLSSSEIEKIYDKSFYVLANFVDANKGKIRRLFVEGHTDSTGTKSNNAQLSKNRSLNSIKKAAACGVPKSLMRSIYVADNLPIYYGEDAHKNRRTEFIVIGSKEELTKYNNFISTVKKKMR